MIKLFNFKLWEEYYNNAKIMFYAFSCILGCFLKCYIKSFFFFFWVILNEPHVANSVLIVVLHLSELLIQEVSKSADLFRNKSVSHWQLGNVFWAYRSILWSKISGYPKSLTNPLLERFLAPVTREKPSWEGRWNGVFGFFFEQLLNPRYSVFSPHNPIETNSENKSENKYTLVCPA